MTHIDSEANHKGGIAHVIQVVNGRGSREEEDGSFFPSYLFLDH